MNLYKVKVEIDIMVVAKDNTDAVEVAKNNVVHEIAVYGVGNALKVTKPSDISNDWKSAIPYAPEGYLESRKCLEIIGIKESEKKELSEEEIQTIISVKENSSSKSVAEEVKQENKREPKTKELNWNDSQSGRPLLRFLK